MTFASPTTAATIAGAIADAATFADAARALGISVAHLRRRRRALGITVAPGRARPALTRSRITAALREHGTGVAAARALGVAPSTLYAAARALGVTLRGWSLRLARARLLDALARSTTLREAARALSVSLRGLHALRRRTELRERPLWPVSAVAYHAACELSADRRELRARLGLGAKGLRRLERALARRRALDDYAANLARPTK